MVTYGVWGCKINLPVSEKRQPEADDRLNLHLNIVVYIYIYYILWQNHIENGRSLQYDICKCVYQCVCVCVGYRERTYSHSISWCLANKPEKMELYFQCWGTSDLCLAFSVPNERGFDGQSLIEHIKTASELIYRVKRERLFGIAFVQ